MIARIAGPILVRTALVAVPLPAAEVGPRSILVLDQSEANAPFYYQIFSGLRSAVNADAGSDTTLYSENLDLSRFDGAACEENLRQQLDVSESSLPPHREIRFCEPGPWKSCRWQSISVFALLLIQAALISILLQERQKRNDAGLEARQRTWAPRPNEVPCFAFPCRCRYHKETRSCPELSMWLTMMLPSEWPSNAV
jgi:hypothetical protein